jgi:hypothetical protein
MFPIVLFITFLVAAIIVVARYSNRHTVLIGRYAAIPGIRRKYYCFYSMEKLVGSPQYVLYNDEEMRIENDTRGFRNHWPPKLFKKMGLLKVDRGNIIGCSYYPGSIKIVKAASTVTILCYDKGYAGNLNTITVKR